MNSCYVNFPSKVWDITNGILSVREYKKAHKVKDIHGLPKINHLEFHYDKPYGLLTDGFGRPVLNIGVLGLFVLMIQRGDKGVSDALVSATFDDGNHSYWRWVEWTEHVPVLQGRKPVPFGRRWHIEADLRTNFGVYAHVSRWLRGEPCPILDSVTAGVIAARSNL